jgi:hypothetical protein
MFNLFKVTNFLQSVPSTINPEKHAHINYFPESNLDSNIYNAK